MRTAVTCCLLILALASARAQIVPELPDEMIGSYDLCYQSEHQEIFVPRVPGRGADLPDDCNAGGGVHFWETGNSGSGRGYCEYDRIEKIASGVYRAHAICHGQSGVPETEQWTEYTELEIIDGRLVATDIDEG
jgi:hypothetical protein